MSRDDGFSIADLDVGFLRDVKVRRLRLHLPEDDVAPTTLLYLALVLSSWEEGFRLSVMEADSPYPATAERIAALQACELIDDEQKIPAHAWRGWFYPAWDRREKKRKGGAEGNRRRWHADKGASHTDSESDTPGDSDPESPTSRTGQSGQTSRSGNPSARADVVTTNGATTHDATSTLPTNGRTIDLRTCPTCGDEVDERDTYAVEVVSRQGQLAHRADACPGLAVMAEVAAVGDAR